MVLSFVWRWLGTLLTGRGREIPGTPPPQARIDFLGRAPLTRPSSPDSGLNSQSKPLLTILPPEIRCQIWEEVVGGHTFHLLIGDELCIPIEHRRRFVGWMCESANPSTCNMERYGARCRLAPLSEAELMERKHILALLLICRPIYSETVDLLYSSNSFIVYDSDVMYYLPSILLPQRINSIRSLRFDWAPALYRYRPRLEVRGHAADVQDHAAHVQEDDYARRDRWITIWHIIASMQSLQDLRVRLHAIDLFWGDLNTKSTKVLLQPIREVIGPENFTLTLPYPAMDGGKPKLIHPWIAAEEWQGVDPLEELPCTIRRVDGY